MYSFELEPDCWICVDKHTNGVRLANTVANFIWRLFQEGASPAQIASQIVSTYEVDERVAQADVAKILHSIQHIPGLLLKEPEAYQPIKDFIPSRPHGSVESATFFLPGFSITFAVESADLINYLNDLFTLTGVNADLNQKIDIAVFSSDGKFPIVYEGETLDTGLTIADAAIKCLREVNGIIGRKIPNSIIFHASAVSQNDKAVLFPATGGSGKTTLAAYLMTQGYKLLNDDAVPLCKEKGLLHPIPLSLSIKQGSWQVLERWLPHLAEARVYGAPGHRIRYLAPAPDSVCTKPTYCPLIVIPQYDEKCHELQSLPMTKRDAFEHIIQSGCILDRPVSPGQIQMLVNWLKPLPCYRLKYRNMVDVKLWLDSRL